MLYSELQFSSDFLKLRNFYYDLVLLEKRPQNCKNKNVEEKLMVSPLKLLPSKCSLPPLIAKIVICLKGAVFEKFVPCGRKREGERTLCWVTQFP